MIDQRGSNESTLTKQPSRTKAWIRRLVSCGPAVAVVGSLPWSLFEPWCSPFLPHATALVLLFLVCNLAGRHWRTSGVLGLAGIWGIWSWGEALASTENSLIPASQEHVISAGFANLGINPAPVPGTPSALQDWVGDQPLDLLGVVECSSSQVEHIRAWQRWHSVHAEPDDQSANGIALFSMFPIRSVEISRTPNARLDHLTAVVDGPTGTFQVEVTHPCPPVPGWLHQRQAELDHISDSVRSSNRPILVLGDLNETPFGKSWRAMLKSSGMVAVGPLSAPTWPTQLKGLPLPRWLGIRIDHMLIGPRWEAGPVEVGPRINSDHRPIRAKVWLSPSKRDLTGTEQEQNPPKSAVFRP